MLLETASTKHTEPPEKTAPASPPRLACLSFPKLLSSGDLEGATACLARKACLITPDATAVYSRDRIRPLLAQLIARGVQIEVEVSNVLPAGDVAFVRERWKIRSDGVEGSDFEQTTCPAMVLHQIEGRWKLAIVAPWGQGNGLIP